MGRKTIKQELLSMTAGRRHFGESKHAAQQRDQERKEKNPNINKLELETKQNFYSPKTYKQYIDTASKFVRWANEQHGKRMPADSQEIRSYIPSYLQMRIDEGKSAWTIQSERSALSKIFLVDTDYIEVPTRTESVKGRGSDPHWNPDNHQEQMSFYSSVGARKNEYRYLKPSEIRTIEERTGQLLPRDIHGRVSNLQPEYNAKGLVKSVTVLKAKHGKTNHSVILPEHQKAVTDVFRAPDTLSKYYNPSDHTNVHAARREYAQALYRHFARDVSSLPEESLYRCRGRNAGCVYDKRALDKVSRSLGHGGGRHYDVVNRYLR